MTMPSTLTYELETLKAKFPGYDFEVKAKEETLSLEPKLLIKYLIKALKENFETVNFSLNRNSYDAVAIIKVKAKPKTFNLAWYQNDSIGFVGDDIYYDIKNYIESDTDFKNYGFRVRSFILGNRELEYAIYY